MILRPNSILWQRIGCCLMSLLTILAVTQPAQALLLDDVYNLLNTVHTRMKDTQSRVTNTQSRVTSVQTRVEDLNTRTTELLDRVRSGADALTEDVTVAIEEAIEDIQLELEEVREGREAFIASEVPAFRAELLAFVSNVEEVLNLLGSIGKAEPGGNFQLARLRALVENAPDRALFPIARGMKVVNFAELNANLESIVLEFAEVSSLLLPVESTESLSTSSVATSSAGQAICDRIQNPERVDKAVRILKISGAVLKLTGEVVKGIGEQTTSKDIGFHGYVHITVQTNAVKTVGTIVAGLGEAVGKVADFVAGARADCEVLSRHAELMTRLDSFEALDTRIAIESHLSGSGKSLAVFFLPEAQGGLLEVVRDIVASLINGEGLGGVEAQTVLDEGQSAFDSGDYRGAYDKYRQAYLEATQWSVPLQISPTEDTGQYKLSWESVDGGSYSVETSEELATWKDVYLIVNSEDGTAELKHVPEGSTEFYRVIRTDQ